MKVEEAQLKTFLLDAGLVGPAAMRKAEAEVAGGKKTLREVLLNSGVIQEEAMRRLEAYILGIPFVDLSREIVPAEVLRIIPEALARAHNIVAYRRSGKDVEVAMLDPDDLLTVEFIRKKEGVRILPRLATTESIQHVLRQYQKSLEAEFGEILKKEIGGISVAQEDTGAGPETEDLKKLAEDLPVIRIVEIGRASCRERVYVLV